MPVRKHTTAPASAPYPPAGPVGDLLAVEAMLDLLRIAIEKDFAVGRFECRQESAAVVCGHALHLTARARVNVAEELAAAPSRRSA